MSDSSNGEHVKSLAQAMRICRPMNRAGRLKITQTLDRCGPCPWPTIRGFYSNSAGVVPGNSSRKDRIFTQDNRSVGGDRPPAGILLTVIHAITGQCPSVERSSRFANPLRRY